MHGPRLDAIRSLAYGAAPVNGNYVHRDPGSSADVPTDGFGWVWSHDLLQRGELWRPQLPGDTLHTRRLFALLDDALDAADDDLADELYAKLGDLERQPSLTLPAEPDSDGNEGWVDLGALTLGDIARWAFDTPADMTVYDLVVALRAEERASLTVLAHELRQPDVTSDQRLLTRFLHDGLEKRHGSYLTGAELLVYVHVVARGVPLGSLRVCESCSVVHEARRARRCRPCRKSPPRPTPQPWHTKVDLPDRRPRTISLSSHVNANGPALTLTLTRPRIARLTYTGICQGCGQEFSDKRGDVAYCDECQLPRNRTRRSRARRASLGRRNGSS